MCGDGGAEILQPPVRRYLKRPQRTEGGELPVEYTTGRGFLAERLGQRGQIQVIDRQIDIELLFLIESRDQTVRGPPTIGAQGKKESAIGSGHAVERELQGL